MFRKMSKINNTPTFKLTKPVLTETASANGSPEKAARSPETWIYATTKQVENRK